MQRQELFLYVFVYFPALSLETSPSLCLGQMKSSLFTPWIFFQIVICGSLAECGDRHGGDADLGHCYMF